MTDREKRQEIRHKIWREVTIRTQRKEVLALATDISSNGLGARSSLSVFPGTRVVVIPQLFNNVQLFGSVVWQVANEADDRRFYQMGIYLDCVVVLSSVHGEVAIKVSGRPDSSAVSFHEKPDLIEEILLLMNPSDD
jgi:hypothetical protein